VDEAVMWRNLRRMAELAAAGGVRLRPHAKDALASWSESRT
jgi:D-serine deaminase-like pyridoxal phosphate-dependent protein